MPEHTVETVPARVKFESIRRFRDPIHDYMPFGPLVCSIIDTPQFQRLRNVKQLGTSYYVWAGASHNRFEHCLGVAYLAQTIIRHLQQAQPELDITDKEVDCVTIAGLCHDLGHGPWSHVWDGIFIPNALPDCKWKHEDASEMMFKDLVENNNIPLLEDDIHLIMALIAGDHSRCKDAKRFLFDIVANKRNGLDVDKFDYIARDSRVVFDKGFTSITRLIDSSRVIEDQICYNIKDANQVYELYYTRFSLHKQIYNHKTAKAIEYMIVDALLAAEPVMQFAKHIHDPKKFLYLTDEIRTRIESSEDPRLAEAQRIFERINTRDLYKAVDYKIFPWSYIASCKSYFTPDAIVAAAKKLNNNSEDDVGSSNIENLDAKHVIVDLSPMHYGMQDRNPLDNVKFYSKHKPNVCLHAGPGDISLLMPEFFGEVLLRIYTRESCFFGLIQAGYRECLKHFKPDIMSLGLGTPPPNPRAPLSRSASRTSLFGADEPFTDNHFTSVPKNYQPASPKGAKRSREEKGNSPNKRRVSMH
ncbi:HD-domain/PDEase-like protein [Panus rudis PR-1116 ss-1]|nr:HD-domain/PDEase-like protein [Panus rudis PR-1116 ss-1]